MPSSLNLQLPIPTEDWTRYSLFGLTLASNFTFSNRVKLSGETPDLTLICTAEAPIEINWDELSPVFESSNLIDSGKSFLYIYQNDGYDVLRFSEVVDFYLWPDKIICQPLDPDYDYMVEIHFLGTVLSIWLERRQVLALHASAVVIDDQAVGFLATNQGGKSSLAASLTQLGHSLLTDDLLPTKWLDHQVISYPSYPQMRMWPDQAEYFMGDINNLTRFHPAVDKRRIPVGENGLGQFCDAPKSLKRLYVPERRDPKTWGTSIEIIPMSPKLSLIELVRHSFSSYLVDAMGLQPQRMILFTQIVQNVTVHRLIYPTGMHYMPAVCEAILADLID